MYGANSLFNFVPFVIEWSEMNERKIKILLVDDNEIIRIMFSNIFWLHGLDDKYSLATALRIEEARALIDDPATRPDFVFMGLVMPMEKEGKTVVSAEAGFSLLKHIRENLELTSVRVIILSGYNDIELQKKALEMGAERYLNKSESMPQDIIEVIRSLGHSA